MEKHTFRKHPVANNYINDFKIVLIHFVYMHTPEQVSETVFESCTVHAYFVLILFKITTLNRLI